MSHYFFHPSVSDISDIIYLEKHFKISTVGQLFNLGERMKRVRERIRGGMKIGIHSFGM